MSEARIDGNYKSTLIGVSSSNFTTPTLVAVNPTTRAMLVEAEVTLDPGALATADNQTNGSQKTQIVDAGGEAATVTGGKLDVNASIDTTGLATSAAQATLETDVEGINTRLGEVQASPTANTVLDRLKALLTELQLKADFSETQPVSLASVPSHAVTNAGTFAVQNTAATPAGTNNIGDVDVLTLPADPLGANADAAVTAGSTGSISGKLRTISSDAAAIKTAVEIMDDWDESDRAKVNIIAGQTGIEAGSGGVTGKTVRVALASDISIPAGTNLVGKVSAGDDTSAIYNGTSALTPKFVIIDAATSGDNTILAAVTSKKIRVHALLLVAAGTVNVRFESGAGGTALSGQMNLVANTGFVLPYNPVGWFETASNTLLNLELSAAISVDGLLVYTEV